MSGSNKKQGDGTDTEHVMYKASTAHKGMAELQG